MSAAPLRRVLIVSPHFPPINAPDMQRVRMSLMHYRACGWEPIVLCVGDAWQDGVREPGLADTLPPDIRIVRVPALPLGWTRLLGVGNLGLRCWFHFLFAGARLLRREKIDLVFFSNTQFVTFPLGRIWRTLLGTPYVFDIQDPWRTDYYERRGSRRPPGGWKYRIARLMAWVLEGWSFRQVSGVMSVSPNYLDDLRARYANLSRVPMAVIEFGGSPDDMVQAEAILAPPARFAREKGEIHVVYTGASGPVMPHSVTFLFQGLKRYHERAPERARRLRFHFLGTSYVAPSQGKNSVMPVAQACGVGEQVDEIPHRLGHLECLRLQKEADILLLPGSSDSAYSPSKIYPYYLSGRPILGIVFRNSVLERLLDELSCAYLVRVDLGAPNDEAHERLGRYFDLATDEFPPGSLPLRNDTYFNNHFLAETLTGRQCELFDQAASRPTSDRP
jgi:hypothetical protein